VPVVFTAAADAPIGGQLVSLTGTGGNTQAPVRGRFSQRVRLIAGPGDLAIHSVELSQLAVVVVEESPFSVHVVPPAAPLVPDGALAVTVKVTRAKGFTEPLDVTFPSLPPGVEVPTSVQVPAGKSEVVVTLVGHPPAEVGHWRLIAEAQPARPGRGPRDPLAAVPIGMGGRRQRRVTEGVIPVASEVVALTVAEPSVKGRFAPAAGEQGKSVTVRCQLEVVTPLAGTLTATLGGLPPRAAAEPVEVNGNARQVAFTVTIDPTTPPGEHRSLVCELSGSVVGHKVVYRVGRGGSLRVDAAGAVKTDATGKPLSPLDALRQAQKKGGPKKP
jgi:hypothetical protein